MSAPSITLAGRKISSDEKPLVIAEIGINHEGDFDKAIAMVDAADAAGCECVKFQCHITEEEMIPNNVIPGNATVSIWDIIDRCTLTELEEIRLKQYVEDKGLIYLCTPFSRAAFHRLERMGVLGYKVGSGECNNFPMLELIAATRKPTIISTGMNGIETVRESVEIFERHGCPYALLHCTSMYPTPYDKVRLGAIKELKEAFPNAPIGLSDHSLGCYTCFASVALGCSILEKHFTADKRWPGPDISISLDPEELKDLIDGSNAIHAAMSGSKVLLPEEQVTANFAYASVVAIRDIEPGTVLSNEDIWVKRPGTGNILARDFSKLIGRSAKRQIRKNQQISWEDV